ncbi:hypothetical protein VXN63_10700 [Marinilactibacillus sp. XAAS-LB27]|uniref:hypothetical protein n=1 Tax=Marinilactibacillus sp. XAAS-LB27 TaxID=3114538 RepID=UPI002E197384|nr:hypothetical protein [Marinilactibacillus sp. XAAS-LB27]
MNKPVVNMIIKAGKAIITLISNQIVDYLSSEEFSIRVKLFIEEMVTQLVKLVVSEKDNSVSK